MPPPGGPQGPNPPPPPPPPPPGPNPHPQSGLTTALAQLVAAVQANTTAVQMLAGVLSPNLQNSQSQAHTASPQLIPGPNPSSDLLTAILENTAATQANTAELLAKPNAPKGPTGPSQKGDEEQLKGFREAISELIRDVRRFSAVARSYSDASLLGSSTVLGQSFQYLTGVIGGAALPAFVVVGAAAVTAADYLRDKLGATAQWWAGVIRDQVVPQVNNFGGALDVSINNVVVPGFNVLRGAVGTLVDAMIGLQSVTGKFSDWILFKMGRMDEATFNQRWDRWQEQWDKQAHRQKNRWGVKHEWIEADDQAGNVGAGDDGKGGGKAANQPAAAQPKGLGDMLADNFVDLVAALRTQFAKQNGANVGFSGVADIWKQIQQASFQSNLEAKQQENWNKQIDKLEEIAKLLRQSRPALAK